MTENLHIWSRESSTRLQDQGCPVVVQLLAIPSTALALLQSAGSIREKDLRLWRRGMPQSALIFECTRRGQRPLGRLWAVKG